MRSALQWRLLLLWILVGAIPTALLALPLSTFIATQLSSSVHAAEWASAVNLVMLVDLMEQWHTGASALAGTGIAAVIALLASIPFLNAMFVGASRSDQPLRLGPLLHAGLTDYGPMLRLMLVSLIPLGIALGLGALAMKGVHKYVEHAILESDARAVRRAGQALAALLFIYAHAGVTAGRAWLAFDPGRRSAFRAWWCGAKLVFFHPLRCVGLYLTITLLAALGLVLLSLLRVELPTGSVWAFLVGFAVVQAIVAVTAWMHYARLFALLGLTRAQAG
ncbi:MAG TPA: hypothetical protein VH278_08130 [Burkholderiaceae bacterium]|nr:hypothetical protein [Burkholderiaceae bacterium]